MTVRHFASSMKAIKWLLPILHRARFCWLYSLQTLLSEWGILHLTCECNVKTLIYLLLLQFILPFLFIAMRCGHSNAFSRFNGLSTICNVIKPSLNGQQTTLAISICLLIIFSPIWDKFGIYTKGFTIFKLMTSCVWSESSKLVMCIDVTSS